MAIYSTIKDSQVSISQIIDNNPSLIDNHVPKDFTNNYILRNVDGSYGGKVQSFSGLNVNLSPLRGVINGDVVSTNQIGQVSLDPRSANIIYAKHNDQNNSIIPLFDKYKAVYPVADSGTVGQWIFNKTGVIPNNAAGSGIAVANDLTPMGTVTLVDGWADYGIQDDGSSGYYVSNNYTNIPTGNAERELDIVFTVNSLNTQYLALYGSNSASNYIFGCGIVLGNLSLDFSNGHTDTGFGLEIGKTYFVSICYDTIFKVFVNGALVNTNNSTPNTQASALYIGRYLTAQQWSNATFHYVELRNKVRTPQQIAAISNKLCLPCHYTGYNASYPTNDATSGAHIYKFDDASGTTVTDEDGTLNGTATGTTIIDSEIGLGKARKFNGTSDFISLGNYAFPNEFTIICVADITYNTNPTLINNYYGNANGNILQLSSSGTLNFYSDTNGGWVASKSGAIGKSTFYAVSFKNNQCTFYVDSPQIDSVTPFRLNTNSYPLLVGKYIASVNYFINGIYEYLAIIPRALPQPEIAPYYNALMVTKDKTLIDDCLPSNSISLGFARTGSSQVIEYNDSDYWTMRNEGATKAEGNKRVFLGWKYFSGVTTLTWQNPFGTRKIKTYFTCSQDANGTNESDIIEWGYGITYGLAKLNTSSNRICVQVQANGVTEINGAWQVSGYLGCYAELL